MKLKNASKKYSTLFIIFLIALSFEPASAQSTIEWIDMEEAQKQSEVDQKPVFVFVEAEWCGFCKKMKREVFPQTEISGLMNEEYYGVLVDLESKNEIAFNGNIMTEREFSRSMEVMQTPTMIFLGNDGEELGRQPGYLGEDDFYKLLRYVTSDDFGVVPFKDFSAGR